MAKESSMFGGVSAIRRATRGTSVVVMHEVPEVMAPSSGAVEPISA